MFAWLMISDHLNTRDMLKRRKCKVAEDVHRELCAGRIYEDRQHLVF
jgi:hypothetical protein